MRQLSPLELAFFWDGRFNGTEDSIHHVKLRLLDPTQDEYLFSEANITNAWLSTKRRHPLAGATINLLPGTSLMPHLLEIARSQQVGSSENINGVPASTLKPHFSIQEHDLLVLRPEEADVVCRGGATMDIYNLGWPASSFG